MASRLERLFALIEHGESTYLRKTAAFQIGEIIKTHPNELEPLLEKIKPLLTTTSWDTRIAASQAIEYIIKNLTAQAYILSIDSLLSDLDGYAKLHDFDLDGILASGAKLLSADTEKYEIKDEQNGNETLNTQRKLLNQKLGIDVAGAAGLDTTHLFTDEDLILNKTATIITNTEKINEILLKQFHARRRVPTPTTPTTPDIAHHQPEGKRLKRASQTSILEQFTGWLMGNLYVPEWEIRHGVATALRELFKNTLNKIKFYLNDLDKLEDFLVKLLTIITLDRFADYVGDEVIAPIRETCSQLIGILVKHLNLRQTEGLCGILNRFIQNKDNWEIRHSGILVLKYVVASLDWKANKAEGEKISLIINLTFDNILMCISDQDDDVRQVATQSLVPISKELNSILNMTQCEKLIKILIDVLRIIDDLSTSCTSIMCLLCDLLEHEKNLNIFLNLFDLNEFLKRLYLYIRHTNLNVKQITLNTFIKIFQILSSHEQDQQLKLNEKILQNLFRLLYQQTIIETDLKCLELIERLWVTLCGFIKFNTLIQTCFPYITTWLLLFMYPIQQPIDSIYLIQIEDDHGCGGGSGISDSPSGASKTSATHKEYIGGHQQIYEDIRKRDAFVMQCRLHAARLLAILFNRISLESEAAKSPTESEPQSRPIDSVLNFLCTQITYKSGLNRICFALIMVEWGDLMSASSTHPEQQQVKAKILELLNDNTIYYDEISSLFTRMQKECKTLASQYKSQLGLSDDILNLNVYTFEDALSLVGYLRTNINKFTANQYDTVTNAIQQLNDLIQKTSNEQDSLQLRSNSLLACASISCKYLTDKMNPLIRPLMESIRLEGNEQLQKLSCKYLVVLLRTCSTRQPNPNSKIFKNLLNSLCCDPTRTPVCTKMLNLSQNELVHQDFKHYYELNRYYGVLSVKTYVQHEDLSAQQPLTPKLKRNFSEMSQNEQSHSDLSEDEKLRISIEKRGAEYAVLNISQIYADEIEAIVPDVIQAPLATIETYLKIVTSADYENSVYKMDDGQLNKYQELINSLQLIEYICTPSTNLNSKYIEIYISKLDDFLKLVNNPLCALRHVTSRTIASISKLNIKKCMNLILENIIHYLDKEDSLYSRQGACELVYQLLEKFNYEIVPYIVLLIIPVLKRMTDYDRYIRTTASLCFSTLIKLYPLKNDESGSVGDGVNGFIENENLKMLYNEQHDFLEQLCDNKKLKKYNLDLNLFVNKTIQLRTYQQDGINWLAFLKRFNLHGILCDDMGLGKTLQSICILAGDYYEKAEHEQQRQQASIIVCPTTLANHWYHEIKRFISPTYLRPFIYNGSVSERENLKRTFMTGKKCNVFIVSYEIVRHDIQFISSVQWNYCILDEGHLIKSTKTKLSKAIKQINASHRLILTGTPIQNNVCELWCLFDFLIPGYLGTEKQFHAKYARHIAPQLALSSTRNGQKQNNDENSIGMNQESLIALESLHKQVLPFLLRRTKEEVLKDLPPKIIQDYYCEMSTLQIKLYEDFAKSEKIKTESGGGSLFDLDENTDDGADLTMPPTPTTPQTPKLNEHAFQALQYLRKVVNHPTLVLKPDHPKYKSVMADLKSTNSHLNDIKHSGKLLALKDLLYECGIGGENNENVVNQHRVLIFCQLKAMIDIIEHELLKQMENVSYLRLDGTIPAADRYGIVYRFNSDPSIDILLLTTQIGGLGLNLTGADTVIFVEHDWNPTKDLQAMDRAHRIGQTKVVNVYRLITKRTIEEKIMSLQKFKTGIANSIVNIDNSSLSTMGTEQLLDLFSKETANTSQQTTSSETQPMFKGSYQRLLDNLTELWDEKQYESEYNLDNFIKSLNSQ